MPETKRTCEWFVRTDARTNEVVAGRLAELQMIEESVMVEIIAKVTEQSFENFSAWRVPHSFITEMEKSKQFFKFLKFSVYRRWQGQDFAEPWLFGKRKKSAKVVKAKKDLETLKKKKMIK
jgi:hypothetical protein